MIDTIKIKALVEIEIKDAHDKAIHIGSVLRSLDDGETGVVTKIVQKDDFCPTFFSSVGDMHVKIGKGVTRISNQYNKWEHVPREHQTYRQRYQSWLLRPFEYSEYLDSGRNSEEYFAIEGIMSLLPEDPVNFESGPWADTIEDALSFLASHLDELKDNKGLLKAEKD